MILSFKPTRKIFGDLLVASLYFATLVFLITRYGSLDIKSHNLLLSEYLAAGSFPIPPGYYFLIYSLDLVIRVKYSFVASSAIVLTFFQWWKFKLVLSSIEKRNLGLNAFAVFLLAFSFLFLSPIYIPSIDGSFWYLGKFTQTIWHNSTLICVFPFCILLVFKTFDWLKTDKVEDLSLLLLIGVVIALIKPSFLFCYIPTLPIFIFVRERDFSKRLFQSIGLVLILFAILLIEKYLIFIWDPVLDSLYTEQEKSQVVLNPMKVWLNFSKEPVFDFLTSFPLLIAFLILWRRKAFESPLFTFSLLLLFFALLVYLLFAETGFRELHANFYWQIPIALFICNLSIVYSVVTQFLNEEKMIAGKYALIFSAYLIQVVFGFAYWGRIFIFFTVD